MTDRKGKFVMIMAALVGVVVLMQLFSAITTPLRDAGDDIRAKGCQDATYFWNESGNQCQVSSTNDTVQTDFTHYALSGTFDGRQGGAAFIAILGGVLLVAIFAWTRMMKG